MTLPITAKVNMRRHLEIGGCDSVELAREFGTPLYVLDEPTIRERCREYKLFLATYYPNSEVLYASKALSVVAVLKIIAGKDMGTDITSGGELLTAVMGGVDPQKIYFHGNNKTADDIIEAFDAGVGRFVVDSFAEIEYLARLAKENRKMVPVLVRVLPGIEAHTHKFIQTGKLDSKFGIPIAQLPKAVRQINDSGSLEFIGLHAHIGSQIFKVKPFVALAEKMSDLALDLKKKTGQITRELNLGGGIGVAYTASDDPPEIESYIKGIAQVVKKKLGKMDPKLIIEPGRSIVAQAGVNLYTVGNIKEVMGPPSPGGLRRASEKRYAAVDGGMADNIRPVLYGAKYEACVANKADLPAKDKVTLVGRFCESGDIVIKDIKLPYLERGDTIAVACTGAYGYSMASNYNRVCKPAMVMVSEGDARLIVRGETYKELMQNDIY